MKTKLLLLALCLFSLAHSGITRIATEDAPQALGPYSQAVHAGSYVFVSGQIGVDPKTGKLAGPTIEEQTKQVIKNIEAIIAADGLTLENVVKTEVGLIDLKDFQAMNGVYAQKFSHDIKPARATMQISKLPHEALVTISCTAYTTE